MAEKDRKNMQGKHEDDEETGSGTIGGGTGEIEFRYHDAMGVPTRDDLLPPAEIKRLLTVHNDVHKERVQKQKVEREQRAAVKEGRYVAPTAAQTQKGLRGSGSSQYKKHPISDKAQFSGIDKQVVGIANLNEANTNDEMKEALENQLENRLQHRAAPSFNPRPRPV